ncbi:hypothetical protein B0H14DRAFT_3874592 [Mycena olivaceomarginata]|nr:hypothetical protein B0H14DRAFT_3874592 [Mycena olivaceomarginata]
MSSSGSPFPSQNAASPQNDSPDADQEKNSISTPRMSALRVVLRWVMSTKVLSMLSAVLHLILLAAHIVLYELSRRGLEKRLVFPLHSQTVVSFAITAITTAFGTVYYAALTFITQTLSTRRDLQTNQSLTATHDHAAAWAGIVAAFLRLWDQKAVTASIFGVLKRLPVPREHSGASHYDCGPLLS